MAVQVLRFEPTPNPNALKCVLSAPVSEGSLPFRTAGSAATHPLAAAIFAVDGVAGLLLHKDWLTVSKSPDAKWPAVKRGVEKALATHG
ncbi:MAG TPA: NifU N-terminal domain-containing protein [Phycisphaerales bacterium]|nr:NifU N-terminal domain-containing protein [Phycisphaerales bacterium]